MGVATAAIVGAAAVSAYGAYESGQAAKRGAQAQIDAANAAKQAFGNVPIPTIAEQQIILENPALAGRYSPQQLQAMQAMTSSMANVSADQNAVDAQNESLNQLGQIADGGLTEADKAASRDIQRTVNQSNQARQKAILNQMASRGVLGSGMELAAQLQSSQQAADQQAQASDRLQQEAQARSLQAIAQQGSLAGQLRSQSFGEGSAKAQAQDAINQFNIQNAQNVAGINNANTNQAAMYNLQQQQALNNQAAANANAQEQYNKQLLQTQFANRMGQAQQVSNAAIAQGNAEANMANANAAQTAGMAGAVANGLVGVAGLMKPTTTPTTTTATKTAPVMKIPTVKTVQLPASQYDPFNPGNS